MTGSGTIGANKKLQFQGKLQPVAEADESTRAQLAGLISLLGKRTGDGAIMSFGY
jgi:hypothetical protein